MQLVNTSRDQLLRPLQVVSGIVERRHTLPILANLLLRKVGPRLSVLSTDIEIQIATHIGCDPKGEDVATTVGARKLLDILRALPAGDVGLSLADKRLLVRSGKSRFSLQTLGADEFPTVAEAPEFGRADTALEVPQKVLKHLFGMVHFAMAQQDIRYYLNGMLLVQDGKTLMAVATDGHRLAYASVQLEHPPAGSSRQEAIVPRKTILELQRLLEEQDAPVQIQFAPNQMKFRFADIDLVSKLIEGKFPDFQRVIPKDHKNVFTIDRETLQAALQRAAILTSDKFKGVRWIVDAGLLKINSTNADQEEAQEELEVDYHGDAIDIGFNVSYLLDVLANLRSETVKISLGDSNSSALVTVPNDDAFKYVVMPMRI